MTQLHTFVIRVVLMTQTVDQASTVTVLLESQDVDHFMGLIVALMKPYVRNSVIMYCSIHILSVTHYTIYIYISLYSVW